MKAKIYTMISLISVSAMARPETYLVKKGDTFSDVVAAHFKGPIFGKNGNIKKLRALNPHIKNPRFIYPGTRLYLAPRREEVAAIPVPDVVVTVPEVVVPEAVAPAAPEPALIREVASSEAETTKTSFEVSPYYALTGLSIKDRVSGVTSTLASQMYLGTHLNYSQTWSEKFKSFVGLNLGYVSFEKPTDPAKSLANASKFMSGIGFGVNYRISSDLTSSLSASYQKELFTHGVSTSQTSVDAVTIPSVGGKLTYDLINTGSLALGLSGELQYKFAAKTDSYKVKQGYKYAAAVYLKQNQSFQTDLGVFSRVQDTSLTQQTETGVLLSVTFNFPSLGK